MSIRGVAIVLSLGLVVGGCGGDKPTSTTVSEADLNAMCVGLYDAVDTFKNLPRPLSDDQLANLAALNERIENECG